MPVGVLIDVGSVFLGGLLGGQLGSRLPEKLKKDLTLVFGVSSMAMGVTYLGKVSTLPAVILSVILGLMIGETVHLDGAIRAGAGKMNGAVSRLLPKNSAAMDETRMHQLVSIIVLICASGTCIFGARDSGLTGDHTVLCTKAILDFFTAAIFASSLGSVVAFVALPQLILQLLLFFSAGLILPLALPPRYEPVRCPCQRRYVPYSRSARYCLSSPDVHPGPASFLYSWWKKGRK